MNGLGAEPSPLDYINVSEFVPCGAEEEYVLQALQSTRLTQGPMVARFEVELSRLTGAEYAVACNSGTSALHLALLGLGVGPGDAVIVPALAYVATANVARYVGADVWFCDVRADDWVLDTNKANTLANYLHDELGYTRVVVLPVHLFDASWRSQWRGAGVHQLDHWITTVVDAAHSPYTISELHIAATTYSFFSSKVIACGEGGAVTTDDPELAARMRLYRGQGAPTPGVYHHEVIGYNYRMPELAAAIGLGQIERVKDTIATRRALINRYRDFIDLFAAGRGLNAAAEITVQGGERASGWMTAVLLPEGVSAPNVRAHLHRDGIDTRPFFEPLNTLPMYARYFDKARIGGEGIAVGRTVMPIAESLHRRGICLPTHTALSFADVDRVCERLVNAVEYELRGRK